MVKQVKQNKRHTRLLYNKIKNKPYIIFKGRKIYLKSSNKKLVKHVLNKYFLMTKKRPIKKKAEKKINDYLKSGLKGEYFGVYSKDYTNKNNDKPIKIQFEELTKRISERELRALPQPTNNNLLHIEYRPDDKIKIEFDEKNSVIFDDIEALKRGMPELWKEKKEEIKKKQHAIKLEANKEILKERKLRKIEKRKNLQEKHKEEIKNSENNISKIIDDNLMKFKSNFLKNFFGINKKKNFEREITQQLELFKSTPIKEKIKFYNENMQKMAGLTNTKLKKDDYKDGIKKADIIKLQDINSYYNELNEIEKKLIHQQEKEEELINIDTEKIDNLIDTEQISQKKNYYFIEEEKNEDNEDNINQKLNFDFDEQQANGKYKGGLWNYQIDKIMKPFKTFLFTIPLNNLNDMIKHIKDNNLKKFSFIMNTETIKSKFGGHWIAIYCDVIDDMTFEIYDPLAQYRKKLYNRIYKLFSNLFNDMEIPQYLKFKYNKQRQQSITSHNCGWFCIRFLLMRFQNIPFKQATNYKGIQDNENNIECLKKSYNKFGYI